MYKPELYIESYRNIYANKGAVTKGIDDNTLDGMSYDRINKLIEHLKQGTFQPKAVRRVYIPKANRKKRPLGIPRGDEKLVQEGSRILLERIYEPIFINSSHGFRQGRSCHTALMEIKNTWTGVKWLIDFDIKGYFDNIDHKILLKFLEKRIEDKKFLRLIKGMLKAGYMENWKYNRTYSGTPQGGIISPILANIYLHELDKFVQEKIKLFNKGKNRAYNTEHKRISDKIKWKRKKIKRIREIVGVDSEEEKNLRKEIKELDKSRKRIPSKKPDDPNYKRLRYVRYADDFVLGVIGSKAEAKRIMKEIKSFINEELKLNVAERKTGIRHAKKGTRFLGYDIKIYSDYRYTGKFKRMGSTVIRKNVTEKMQLHIPKDKITQFCKKNKYGLLDVDKSTPRPHLINQTIREIFLTYNAELRGFANYYNLAYARKRRLRRMFYLAEKSLVKTLAAKFKTSSKKIYSQYTRKCELICKYKTKNGQSEVKLFKLKHMINKVIYYSKDVDSIPSSFFKLNRKGLELIKRLNINECEYCGSCESEINCKVYQIKKLTDIAEGEKMWQRVMTIRRRKTLILCPECYDLLKARKLPNERYKDFAELESRMS